MRRRIKVADPRIFLVSAAYIYIREEVVDDNNRISKTASQTNPPLCLPRGDTKRRVRLAGGGESGASSSSTIAMRHSSPKRTAAERDIPGDRRQCSSSIVGYLARDYYGLCAIILAALVLHTSDVRMNICYGNVMTNMKTWNFYALNARALGRSGGVPQENFAIYSV